MPEQITKHPDVTLEVLKGAGAKCGQGLPQKILTKCPPERFCSLPTGEMCIYGIQDIPQMTQITVQELAQVVAPGRQQPAVDRPAISWIETVLLAAVFLAGFALGRFRKRSRLGD